MSNLGSDAPPPQTFQNSQPSPRRPMTPRQLAQLRGKRKLTFLTAYTAPMARLLDQSGIDGILVGDSVVTVLYGEKTTIPANLSLMLPHIRAVATHAPNTLVVADLPFLSYQVSRTQAIRTAGRCLKAGAGAVKLEGGIEQTATIRAIVEAGIPVMGHIGLRPQSYFTQGGYRTHGKTATEEEALLQEAQAIENAGAFAIVLECVQSEVARYITNKLNIPTIGIGSGPAPDGQILVTEDLLGLHDLGTPKFVSPTRNLWDEMQTGVREYIERTLKGDA